MKNPDVRGFTLLEVLVAGSIFLLVFAAASQVFFMTRIAYAQQRDFMTAENIVQQQLERLIVLAPRHPDLIGGPHPALQFDRDGVIIRDGSPPKFALTWSVQENTPLKTTRRLTAAVRWNGQEGEPREISFVTDRD